MLFPLDDYYMKLGEDNLTDTEVLKKALSTRAGMTTDLLTLDKSFSERKQRPGEKGADFV